MDAYQIILGTAMILAVILAPGLALTLALFPKLDEIRWAERIGLGLLFGLMPQVILYFLTKNISVPVTEFTVQATIFGVTLVSAAIWMVRSKTVSG